MDPQPEETPLAFESILRELIDAHERLCSQYAAIGGADPEQVLSLRGNLALIRRARQTLKQKEG
jgi:hypothetical protein